MDREERGSHAMGQLPICSRGLLHPRRTLEPLGGRLRAPTWSGGSGTSGEVNGCEMVGYRCRNDVQGLDFRGVSICPELGLWCGVKQDSDII